MSDAITAPRQPVLPESFDPIIAEMLGRGNGYSAAKAARCTTPAPNTG
jgi:hypothetical protein